MQTSYQGLEFLKSLEAFRASVYDDATGKPVPAGQQPTGTLTIGYGHALKATETFAPKIPESFATALLREDVKVAEDAIKRHVKVALNQNQYDALVSFIFNIGVGAFAKSTLLKRLNNGDYAGAASEFMRWVWGSAKGVKVRLPGLEKRREKERKLFLTPTN